MFFLPALETGAPESTMMYCVLAVPASEDVAVSTNHSSMCLSFVGLPSWQSLRECPNSPQLSQGNFFHEVFVSLLFLALLLFLFLTPVYLLKE